MVEIRIYFENEKMKKKIGFDFGLELRFTAAVKVLEAFRSVNECFAVFFEARKAASLVAALASLVSQCFPMFQQFCLLLFAPCLLGCRRFRFFNSEVLSV